MTNLYSLPDFAAALSGAFQPVAENIKRGFSEQAESRKEREAKKRKTEAEIADAIVFRPENDMLMNIVCPHEVGGASTTGHHASGVPSQRRRFRR